MKSQVQFDNVNYVKVVRLDFPGMLMVELSIS